MDKTIKNNQNIWPLFLLYVSVIFVITFLQQELVLLPELQKIDIIGEESKLRFIERFHQFRWLTYLIPPLFLLIRLSLVSVCLYLGGFFFSQMSGRKYKEWWNVALYAQAVMILYSLLLCIVNVCSGTYSIDITTYSSLLFLAGDNIEPWVKIPLSAINIFELAYWCVLSLFVGKLVGANFGNSLKFVMSSYGVGYLFYVSLMMFFVLYLT